MCLWFTCIISYYTVLFHCIHVAFPSTMSTYFCVQFFATRERAAMKVLYVYWPFVSDFEFLGQRAQGSLGQTIWILQSPLWRSFKLLSKTTELTPSSINSMLVGFSSTTPPIFRGFFWSFFSPDLLDVRWSLRVVLTWIFLTVYWFETQCQVVTWSLQFFFFWGVNNNFNQARVSFT